MFLAASAAAARWLLRSGSAPTAAAACASANSDGFFLCERASPPPVRELRFFAAVGGDWEARDWRDASEAGYRRTCESSSSSHGDGLDGALPPLPAAANSWKCCCACEKC